MRPMLKLNALGGSIHLSCVQLRRSSFALFQVLHEALKIEGGELGAE